MQTRVLEANGAKLALRIYEEAGSTGAPRATVVLGAAMGVPQGYYAAYAQWLADQGYRVWTFDYRGQGESLKLVGGKLRGFKADLIDWKRDYEAVIAAAHAEGPQPLYLIGHSLGAQLPGLLDQPGRISGLLSIAAGSGYWRQNAPPLRRRVLFLWHVLVPLLTPLFGYFPGGRLGMVGDLPAGVIRQWRRWCLHPKYSAAEGQNAIQSYARVRFPIRAWSFDDDEMMTLAGTQSLLGLYAGAPQSCERIAPADVGLSRIGHFGFFRESMREAIWGRSLQVLQSFENASRAQEKEATATAHP